MEENTEEHTKEREEDEESPPATQEFQDAPPAAEEIERLEKSVEELQIEVEFRVGRVTLPLSALLGLAPGSTLDILDFSGWPRVEAVSAGRVFAAGKLVMVGNKPAFHIEQLDSKPSQASSS